MSQMDNQTSTFKASSPESIFSANSNYALFVGKNFGYYAAKWSRILQDKCNGNLDVFRKAGLKQASWNIFAFLFGPIWFAYRKMYLFTFLNFVAFGILPWIYPLLGLVLAVLFGMYGNAMYFRFVDKKLKKLEKEISNPDILKSEIIKTGSTSKFSAAIAIILITFMVLVSLATKDENFFNESNSTTNNGVSYAMKHTINSISLQKGNGDELSVEDIVGTLAGANGEVLWEKNGNDYYIHIKRPEWAGYLKFSHNENTSYVFLSETSVNDRHCVGANDALGCLGLWLKEI